MVYKFTKSGEKVIDCASDAVLYLGHNYIGSEHILYGLAKETNGLAHKILESQGVLAENILQKIEEIIGKSNIILSSGVGFTPRSKKIIENAYVQSKQMGADFISTEHLLLGILQEEECVAFKILLELNCNIEKLYKNMVNVLNDYVEADSVKQEKVVTGNLGKTLSQFGIDLTGKARAGKLDPVIGRKKETERVIEVLSRRTKNNPCLIGEPGVGKTAVIEGLAERIASRRCSR